MLVYLDHAQLVDLERADPAQRDRFLQDWRSTGAELALSLHHLQEAVQLSDALSVDKWLNALRMFDSIRSAFASSATVLDFEIQVQLLTLLGFEIDAGRSALNTFFPSVTVDEIAQHSLSLNSVLRQMRTIHELEADAFQTAKLASRHNSPVSIRRKMDPAILDTLDLDKILQDAGVGSSPETMDLMRRVFDQTREAIRETGTGRAALEHMAGLDHSVVKGIADEDLSAAVSFLTTGRELVDDVAHRVGARRDTVAAIVPLLNPYAAPGFSLRLAVRRGLLTHPRAEKPGNQIDLDHIAFAPYVDVLFADGHTCGFIRQERKSRSERLPIGVGGNVAPAATLNGVIESIRVRAQRPEA